MTGALPNSQTTDIRVLFVTRVVRLFAYGAIALVLVLYLTELGLSEERVGLLLTMTLLGDTVLSLGITTTADRLGRRRMLLAGAALMVLGGLAFAASVDFVVLLVAATLGVISPSGSEVGPFLAIEQAAVAETVHGHRRTVAFAWYQLAGAAATAAGSLACGFLVESLQARGMAPVASYRVVFWGYAGAGLVLAVLFALLSPAVEAAPGELPPVRRLLGLHRSRGVVLGLSGLFALDAFAGGLVLQSIVAYWFHARFGADPRTLGAIFFGANLFAAVSALAAARVARRFGLLNTMVFTHAPSNVLLILVPFMPTLGSAVAVLLARFAISQMDVPARQSYTAAVVSPDERSAAAGVTGVARTTGAACSPVLAGVLLASPATAGGVFIVSGALKLVYDGLVYILFRRTVPSEEMAKR